MGLFKRNKSVDLDEVFKTKYKEINLIYKFKFHYIY